MTFLGATPGADFSLPAPALPRRAGPALCFAAAGVRFGVLFFPDCRFFGPASFAMGLALHVKCLESKRRIANARHERRRTMRPLHIYRGLARIATPPTPTITGI